LKKAAATAGFGAQGAKQEEVKQPAQASDVQVKLTEEEEKNDSFLKQPFDFISKKWIRNVKDNEEKFNEAVEAVKNQELYLFKVVGDIEIMETQGTKVIEAQKGNLEELAEINLHQSALLDELDMIEKELDSFINGQVGSATTNKFLTKIFN